VEFDEKCSKLLDLRKQAKLQWMQNPRKRNGDNLNYIRGETSRVLRTREGIFERKNIEFDTNSKSKNITDQYKGVIEFRKRYQRRTK
jgi:hypothetical protein